MRRSLRQSQHRGARRFALIVRLEFETAEPLSVQGPPEFSKLTLCETRSLTLVLGEHLKPAMDDHFKTGQVSRAQDLQLF